MAGTTSSKEINRLRYQAVATQWTPGMKYAPRYNFCDLVSTTVRSQIYAITLNLAALAQYARSVMYNIDQANVAKRSSVAHKARTITYSLLAA